MLYNFIKAGQELHPTESLFFRELMLLCAKHSVKIITHPSEGIFGGIEFKFPSEHFANVPSTLDYKEDSRFVNLDDERDSVVISGILGDAMIDEEEVEDGTNDTTLYTDQDKG